MVELFSKNLAMPLKNCSTLFSGSGVSYKRAKLFFYFFNHCNPEIAKEKSYSLLIQIFPILLKTGYKTASAYDYNSLTQNRDIVNFFSFTRTYLAHLVVSRWSSKIFSLLIAW